MSKNGLVALGIFLMFGVEPVLLAIGARRIYGRSSALWGIFALITNVGVMTYFDTRLGFRSLEEAVDETGIVLIMGALLVPVVLELLRNLPQEATSTDIFRRGTFRAWAALSAVWMILCAFKLPTVCNPYSCGVFWRAVFGVGVFEAGSLRTSYFDVAKAFIGIPTLGFMIGLVVCWVVDGFRRTTPN